MKESLKLRLTINSVKIFTRTKIVKAFSVFIHLAKDLIQKTRLGLIKI